VQCFAKDALTEWPFLPPPAAAATPPQEWRPELPGQIGFGPTHTGPAAQEAAA
jgi:hypothetical protein